MELGEFEIPAEVADVTTRHSLPSDSDFVEAEGDEIFNPAVSGGDEAEYVSSDVLRKMRINSTV